ncbi:hypothetical protein ACWG0P_08280 [Amedibacillus sp. YH-ame6]
MQSVKWMLVGIIILLVTIIVHDIIKPYEGTVIDVIGLIAGIVMVIIGLLLKEKK